MLRFEFSDFQLDRDEAGQRAVVKQQINEKIRIADLHAVFFADEGEVAAEFEDKTLQIFNDCFAEALFGEFLRQIQKFEHVGVKNAFAHITRNEFRYRFLGRKHGTLII